MILNQKLHLKMYYYFLISILNKILMSFQDQVVEEKTLSFKTLTHLSSDEVAKFVAQNSQEFKIATQDQKIRLFSLTNLMIIPALKSQWSFGLYQDGRIIGVYLQLDVLDYLNICKVVGSQLVSKALRIAQFDSYFFQKQGSVKRGDYLLTIFNVADVSLSSFAYRKEISLIHQGFYLCKLGGWSNILFTTDNPIPFLKINGEVVAEQKQKQNERKKYLMKLNLKQLNLSVSPFQKMYSKI